VQAKPRSRTSRGRPRQPGGGLLGSRGRLPIATALGALVLLAVPSSAATEGEIVIHGPNASSHLRLTVSGAELVVTGYLAGGNQVGCAYRRGNTAVCPLTGVDRVEVDMGPFNDKVEVLDPLPVSMTAHLGAGSDKFIGNSERDFCYPEGTIANGCLGRGGNDVCITGPKNTECFGGEGNDFCRAGPGSDGCWGGPGRDVCYMGAGEDGCHGGPGNDRLYGGPNSDRLFGGPGNDRLYGGPSPDQLYGGPGHDYCDGGPGIGRSHRCEAGPGH
jgi:Ca2+-binding RTX toxin-like protein